MINKNYVDKIPLWGSLWGWGGASWRGGLVWFGLLGLGLLGLGFSASAQVRARRAVEQGGTRSATSEFFQGTCVYRVSARSKVEDLNDKDIHKVLAVGDVLTVTIKDGNYKLSTEYADTYIIKNDRKEYIKFRRIDTVFYLDFDSDTDRVTGVVRNNAVLAVGGYPCKGVTIETSKVSRQYYYSTTLRTNPEDDNYDMLAQAELYATETGGGLKMWIRTDYPYAIEVDSCIRVERSAGVRCGVSAAGPADLGVVFCAEDLLSAVFGGR